MKQFISHSPEETKNLARQLASKLHTGDIIVLSGELGSGKTKFTEGILSYFNLENEISSPTFTIVNEYANCRTTIYHFDVYRLHSCDEFYAIGAEQYLENGICILEWGELVLDALPPSYLHIRFSRNTQEEEKREITFHPVGEYYINLIKEL